MQIIPLKDQECEFHLNQSSRAQREIPLPETTDTGLSGCSGARMVATPERKKALKSRLQDYLLLLPCHMRARSKNAEFCFLLPDDEDGVQDARN